jgi:membrane-bound serine protease (ClpP class)
VAAAIGLLVLGLLPGLGPQPARSGEPSEEPAPAEAPAPAVESAGEDEAAPDPAERMEDKADPDAPLPTARVPVSGVIDTALRTSVARRAGDAVDDGQRLIIFHITSSGGYLEDGLELSRDIQRLGRSARTVAFVDAKAYSAAAIIAFSCQEIVMTPEASIGACTPYMGSPVSGVQPMEEEVRAKIEGTIIERLETLAEKHGYPKALLKAMVAMPTVVIEARNEKTGEIQYVEEEDLFAIGPDWKKGETVVSGNEVLTVGAEEARTYRLAKHVVPRLDRLYDLYPIKDRIEVYPVTWNETLVSWLNNMYFKALLVLVGLLGIYVEMHTPGVGVPGAIGLAAFGLLFATSFLAGRPEWLPVLLFVGGMAMLAVELLVTPGFGVLGGVGAALVLASIILALPPSYMEPGTEGGVDWDALARSLAMTAVVMVVFVISAMVLARYLPQMPLLKQLVLSDTSVSDGSSRAAAARQEKTTRLGETGRTTTMLRPAGKARIGDRLVDVVTDGEFLDAETPVRVVQVRGNRIVVAPAPDEASESETESA